MLDLFTALSTTQRQAFRAHYLRYLRTRDGVPNRENHTLETREQLFLRIEANPVVWVGAPPVDHEVFDRNQMLHTPESGLDDRTLWALATAKVNRSERYGVELSAEHCGFSSGEEDPQVYVEIEEFYHTRILCDALRTIGLEMTMCAPGSLMRMIIHSMIYLPECLRNVTVFVGEIVGVMCFRLLLDKGRELFANQPQVVARIETLFSQILVDEVGHVHYVRSLLGQTRLRMAKLLHPLIAGQMIDQVPELARLFGREQLLAEILKTDVDGASASFPDRFQPLEVPIS